jgi:hypothetical protein
MLLGVGVLMLVLVGLPELAMARRPRRGRHDPAMKLRELNVSSPAAKALAQIAMGRSRGTPSDRAWRNLHDKFVKDVQVIGTPESSPSL